MPRLSVDDPGEGDKHLTDAQKQAIRDVQNKIAAQFDTTAMRSTLSGMADLTKYVDYSMANLVKDFVVPRINFGDVFQTIDPKLFDIKVKVPELKLDYAQLFAPALNFDKLDIAASLGLDKLNVFDDIFKGQREQFEKMFSNIETLLDKMRPPNWHGLQQVSLLSLETMILDEGLALGWVPDTETLERLFAAATKQERRKIIGQRWKRIVASSRLEVEPVSDPKLLKYRKFAIKTIAALEDGHTEGAQALAANLLDTMLRETLDATDRKMVTDQRSRLSIDDLPIRAAIVLGGIWGSHTQFWQSRGDKIPREFTRHGSAHGVSDRQYSRINAVIAVTHVTAYLKLLDSGDLGEV